VVQEPASESADGPGGQARQDGASEPDVQADLLFRAVRGLWVLWEHGVVPCRGRGTGGAGAGCSSRLWDLAEIYFSATDTTDSWVFGLVSTTRVAWSGMIVR
jgi:hypothetical protein